MNTLRIGTRGSPLALWQARTVAGAIEQSGPDRCTLVIIRTSGDRLSEASLSAAGGKRLFVKELEDALLQGEVDLAVHSAKDLPAILPDGLVLAAVLPREDPRDALVLPRPDAGDPPAGGPIAEVPGGEALAALLGQRPRLGTSSVRRIAQIARALPRAEFHPIRGNLDTRLRKLDAGQFSAIVLAVAGMKRLGWCDRISAALPVTLCMPAPGQGIVAVETRAGDVRTREVLARVSDAPSLDALVAERALVEALGGGCQLPIGALAEPAEDGLVLRAAVASLDGSRIVRAEGTADAAQAASLGRLVAQRLLDAGAAPLLDEARAGTDGEGL
jgi:hydroxymethylbilane synthase